MFVVELLAVTVPYTGVARLASQAALLTQTVRVHQESRSITVEERGVIGCGTSSGSCAHMFVCCSDRCYQLVS